ncbi:MFS transporter (plasmid) [Deinococcus sp. KNUC1210]|uniref:MFS transporter n=1 Tax=Deinococcus sp. KNUC1210 TaxID=2917691 RepID=UPI001EF0A546|nr:MFS transporter [Deinococcus sp. KNUC1210]ULH16950.1 MFS transporter [Deinococcus sp. KNUC1210]
MQLYSSLLRERRVAVVWVGETLNAFGSGLSVWALAWLLLRTYPGEPLLVALVLTVLSGSSLLGTIFLGPRLDVWDRRRTLMRCNFALALLTALLPLVAHTHLGPFRGAAPLLMLVAAGGVLRSLPAPALSATLPQLARSEHLGALQALFNLTWMTGDLVAGAIAGLLISGVGINVAFWIDAATFLVAGLGYALVQFPAQSGSEQLRSSGVTAWWTQLREGWGFVGRRPALWGMFLGLGMTNAYFSVFGSLVLPRVGERLLGPERGPLGVGLIDAVSVGAEVVASIWLGRTIVRVRAVRPLVLLGCIFPVILATCVVFAPSYPLAMLFALLNGLSFAPLSVLVAVYVARHTPAFLLGRVSSARSFFSDAGRPLAMTVSGTLLTLLGLGPMVVTLAGSVVLLSLFGFWKGAGQPLAEVEVE